MFDLNEAVAGWRKSLTQQEGCRVADVEEMESHLRDEVEHLRAANLSDEETFLVATHRLGDATSLAREFAKVNRGAIWGYRLFWIAAGLLVYALMDSLAGVVSLACVTAAAISGSGSHGLTMVSFAARALTFGGVLFLLYKGIIQGGCGAKFYALAAKPWGAVLLVGGILVLILLSGFLHVFIVPIAAFRLVEVERYAHMSESAFYASMVWSVLVPLLLAVLMIKLRPRKTGEVGE